MIRHYSFPLLILSILSLNIASAQADPGSAGKIMIKGRVIGVVSSIKNSKTSDINYAQSTSISNVYSFTPTTTSYKTSAGNSLGAEVSATYFLTDNIAAEASFGIYTRKFKTSGVINGPITIPAVAPSTTPTTVNNVMFSQVANTQLYPLIATIQYHIAPYGKISPYVGAGYSQTFTKSPTGSHISGGHGPVLQAGFDAWVSDNVIVNVDMKKILANMKISYNSNPAFDTSTGTVPVYQKIKVSPLFISAGIGYRF